MEGRMWVGTDPFGQRWVWTDQGAADVALRNGWKVVEVAPCDAMEWKSERYGHDDDHMYGRVKVNYWQRRKVVVDDIDRQLAGIREAMLADFERFRAAGETP